MSIINRYKFVLFLLILSVAGCKTKQNIPTAASDSNVKKEITAATPKMTKPQITSLNYEWLSYRMSVAILDYNTKKEIQSVSAFYVNRKDSIIYITVSKLIELARIVLTPDSVKYIEHLSSTYYSGDYSFINKMVGFNVNFKFLQAIFAGEDIPDFEPNTFFATLSDTNVYTSEMRKNKQMNLSVSQEMKTNSQHKIIENNIKEIQKQLSLSVRYSNFTAVDKSQLFFQQAELSVPSEKMLLNLKLKDTKVNTPGPTSITIPQKYKPINVK
jgi:hypothetical protein